MSCIYKGQIIETDLSKNSRGGTELMRSRLIKYVDDKYLQNVAIHLSRVRDIYSDVKNIFWAHDTSEDPENFIFKNGGHEKFEHFVFVSDHQRLKYLLEYGIPYHKTSVINNAVEFQFYEEKQRNADRMNFIYHTTPHRGLNILYHVFDELSKIYTNIHLDVFSSFDVYGWKESDEPYKELFKKIENHKNMTYHGSVDNSKILQHLEKADIFLYPCIWEETSCLALIEAMMKNCVCIHTDIGALPETAKNNTLYFNHRLDDSLHSMQKIQFNVASKSYHLAKYVLENFDTIKRPDKETLKNYTIKEFTNSWTKLLKTM